MGKENDTKLIEKVTNACKLPKDIVLGASIITAVGNQELWIENFKGILTFEENLIIIQGKKYMIEIQGKRLRISYYSKEDMKIQGIITGVNLK